MPLRNACVCLNKVIIGQNGGRVWGRVWGEARGEPVHDTFQAHPATRLDEHRARGCLSRPFEPLEDRVHGGLHLVEPHRDRGHAPLLGVERDEEEVARCLERGVDVIHANLERNLPPLGDGSFDVAVLSQTLQSLQDVPGTLEELVRIGRRAIVAFPNFAYEPLRRMFMEQGRLPKEEGAYGYDWFDTPNRRFPSILDFLELCETLGIEIAQAIYVESRSGSEVTDDPNRNADLAVVALRRPPKGNSRSGENPPRIG